MADTSSIDTSKPEVDSAPMRNRMKRTYNLSERTVHRVRELSGHAEWARTQDAVVEVAVDRLYREVTDREEAAAWERATGDPDFRAETASIAREYDGTDRWPA